MSARDPFRKLRFPDRVQTHDRGVETERRFRTIMQKARATRARRLQGSTTDVVLLEQRLVSRFVVLLQIIEKRTTRRHELQEAAAGMVVLDVALEVSGQVVDAFRQDRDLNLRGAG